MAKERKRPLTPDDVPPPAPRRGSRPAGPRAAATVEVPPPPPPLPPPPPEVPQWLTPDVDPEADNGPSLYQLSELRRVLAERARRKMEALNLYEPLPEQERFHASKCRQRLARGGNRSGKTLCAAVEVARAVTGKDPTRKYPLTDGRAFLVGKDLDHIGQVMWRKLGRPGAFKIIRDEDTGDWRAFRPWEPADEARSEEAKPAPPLIPKRLVKAVAWENKAKGIPKKVLLTNGWEINFYSSEGKPPQGSDIDLWWFDEEIVDPEWHPEMVARVLDRRGRGLWSATPQAGTEKLLELHDIAEQERDWEKPSVEEFVILLADNPHIGEQEKKDFAATLNEDEQRVRIAGEFLISSFKVYPEYSDIVHGVDPFDIPADWTRYAAIDPGRQVCAVLFAAVPPPEAGEFVYLYDELYIQNCDAEQFGQRMRDKTQGQNMELFIIDSHMSRVTEMGSGRTVEEQYSQKLRKYRVTCRRTGHGFLWGSDDVAGGLEAFRSLLRVREDGTPKLRVFVSRMPNFRWEIKHYRFKRLNNVITDKPEEKGRVHLMADARYLAMARPRYVKRTGGKSPLEGAIKAFRDKQERLKKQRGGEGRVMLGPIGGSKR
jgi:hypothetical protein